MPNKSTSQMTATSQRTDDDRMYIVRSGVDYQITGANMPPKVYAATTLIPSASVLTLNATPVEVVSAAPVGTVIIPIRGLIQFSGGTTDYTTNTDLMLLSTSTPIAGILFGSIADRSAAVGMGPQATVASGACVPEDSLSAKIDSGNPAAGDSDLTITVWYYLFSV